MAMTLAQKTDMYRFFAIAFNAAPGITYMDQLDAALAGGMTTKQVVNAFTTKAVFTATYPNFLDNAAFATSLVNNVVGASATDAAKAQAVADIVGALNIAGTTRGDVIYTVFNNLANKAYTDATWGGTALQLANQVAVSQYYTETLLSNSTDTATLRSVLAGVTNNSNVSTTAAISALIGSTTGGQVFTLTTGIDTAASFTGGAGNDTFNANTVAGAQTFTSLDAIDGGAGTNTFNINSTVAVDLAAATGATVANMQTANIVSAATLKGDVSGWTGLTKLVAAEVGGTAGGTIKAATTTAVTLTDGGVGTGAITVAGGSSVGVTASGITTTGAINIGSSTTSGAITVALTDANTGSANAAAGVITIAGGTTVNATQTIAAATSVIGTAYTATGGAINVNGGAATTTVTATQTAAVAAVAPVTAVAGVAAVSAVTESAAVVFSAVGLPAGKSLTIGGLTVTAVTALSQVQLEAVFTSRAAAYAGGSPVSDETYSGALTGFSTGSLTGSTIPFTSSTANTNVTDLAYTDSNSLTSVTTTQGAAAVSAVTAVTGVTGVGGITDGAVVVTDKNSASATTANTITTVTLDGYGASSSVNSNALTTLTMANSAADVTVNDYATTPNTTLALTVSNLGSGASLVDASDKVFNITASTKASALSLTAAAATTITIAGDQKLTLTGTAALVTSVTSTDTAGVTMTLNPASTGAFGDGADKITVGAAATKAVTLGAGDDTAYVSTLGTGGSVDGGTGTNTLSMAASDAATASLSNVFAGKISNFQKLVLTGTNPTATIDVNTLGAYHFLSAADGSGTLTLNRFRRHIDADWRWYGLCGQSNQCFGRY